MFLNQYDVIVVGAGHAGCEAAAAAANMGCSTLLVTMNLQNIAQMSCNPAMGGIAKGQIVREIDALGGYSGIVSDKTAIQFKMLNKSKGPAMWSPRVQSDRMRFSDEWRSMLENTPNLDFYQEMVAGILSENGKIVGVKTSLGVEIKAKSVVLTNGTFLNGLIHIGDKQFGGGRAGESASFGITEDLVKLGFESGRMKTGTPPRVDGRSLDFSKMVEQPGDEHPEKFSYSNLTAPLKTQRSCWMSYTSLEVHDILREGFDRSPMFNGRIKSLGPRYCPSIEDKIVKFKDKQRHQIFLEPESLSTNVVYPNGISTSLPKEIQQEILFKINGLQNVRMIKAGYAIEYDYVFPTELDFTLRTKKIENLYLAGQINGTTGYEEAAAQGIVAGLNAAMSVKKLEPIKFERSQSYIGVMIDDLITKGVSEPYRMFTSRAEFRTLLRQDNADQRLTPKGHAIGLASEERLKRMEYKFNESDKLVTYFKETSISPEEANPVLEIKGSSPMVQSDKMYKVFSRPQIDLEDIVLFDKVKEYIASNDLDEETIEQAEIQVKYNGYIEKERNNADKLTRLEDVKIPENFDYNKIKSMSIEAKQKLSHIRPVTISQASRISGVTPADLSILTVYLGR